MESGFVEKVFPLAIIALQILATIPYIYQGKWSFVSYWIAASVLNITVTYGMK